MKVICHRRLYSRSDKKKTKRKKKADSKFKQPLPQSFKIIINTTRGSPPPQAESHSWFLRKLESVMKNSHLASSHSLTFTTIREGEVGEIPRMNCDDEIDLKVQTSRGVVFLPLVSISFFLSNF